MTQRINNLIFCTFNGKYIHKKKKELAG